LRRRGNQKRIQTLPLMLHQSKGRTTTIKLLDAPIIDRLNDYARIEIVPKEHARTEFVVYRLEPK